MVGLGWQLTLHSGREAFTRLLLTTVAVAIGVAVLLGVFAEFHAFQLNGNRSCWECTQGTAAPSQRLPDHGELWNYSVDYYQGQTIERLDVAALGPGAPVPPGISRLPGGGQFYASPALAALLRTVPRDELGDRFLGTMIGTIGHQALAGPDELAIYVGYPPSSLATVPDTEVVTAIQATPGQEVFTPFFRYAFGVGVLAVLFPILILISTATRLAAARREERFAALRLVGATPRDVSVIASVDSVVSALSGAVLGIGLFLVIRPALVAASLTGTRYFAATVTPTLWGYLAMLIAVPAASALASLAALRRVRISPLGVSRRASPPPPSAWRLVTLAAGVALFVVGLLATSHKSIGAPAYPGLLLTMVGLVVAGPWLTAVTARWCARVLNGASPLLATHAPPDTSAGQGIAATPPRTYGEAVAIRSGRADVLQRLVYLAVDLTLLVAGCSLAVALGGGLAERKRPFTLLRVSGTPIRMLYRVVFLEAVVPLAAATVLAAAIAYGASILTVVKLAPAGTPVPLLGHVYYATMGAGLAIALIVIGVTLPLLKRMTGPDNARFE